MSEGEVRQLRDDEHAIVWRSAVGHAVLAAITTVEQRLPRNKTIEGINVSDDLREGFYAIARAFGKSDEEIAEQRRSMGLRP